MVALALPNAAHPLVSPEGARRLQGTLRMHVGGVHARSVDAHDCHSVRRRTTTQRPSRVRWSSKKVPDPQCEPQRLLRCTSARELSTVTPTAETHTRIESLTPSEAIALLSVRTRAPSTKVWPVALASARPANEGMRAVLALARSQAL